MPGDDCYDKALELLARRSHFRRVLESKLAARGFAESEIADACERLEERGLLNDRECARELVTGSWRRKGYGPRRVRAELVRRGVADGVIEEVLADGFAGGELAIARRVGERWLERSTGGRDALARHLERKGFGGAAIREVLDELLPD